MSCKLIMRYIIHTILDMQSKILLRGSTYDHMQSILMTSMSSRAIDSPCIHHWISSSQLHILCIQVCLAMSTSNNSKMYCCMTDKLSLQGKNQLNTSSIVMSFSIWGNWMNIDHNWKLNLKRTQNYTQSNEWSYRLCTLKDMLSRTNPVNSNHACMSHKH